MVFAQIKDGLIQNTVMLDDSSLVSELKLDSIGSPYDYVLQVDVMYPQPGIGWTFDGISFAPPIPPPDPPGDE